MERIKIKIEKQEDKYIAYAVGLDKEIAGEGETRKKAVEDVKSAIKAYLKASDEGTDTEDPQHIVAVMGLVRNPEGQILLIRSPDRGWEPPGGQVESGEDVISALKREILEESGIVVEIGRLAAFYSNVTSNPTKLMLTFEAAAIGGELQTSKESPEVGWFFPKEAVEKVDHPAQKHKLQDALLGGDGIMYRVYGTDPYKLLQSAIV